MARLMISLLGPFQARLDGQAVPGLRPERVRALLAFLAVEAGREHTRRNLAELLWSDQPDQIALNNLRYTLSDLRRGLGDAPERPAAPILTVSRDTVRLDPDACCWLDVREFERLCGTPASPWGNQAPECGYLQEAVGLYRGPFLEGFALPGSAAFEDWLFWTREQFQRKMIETLRRLVTHYEAANRYEAAQAAARRQVQLEPLDEAAHRQLIHALAAGGERSAALVQYESCRRTLAQELGVEPMRETIALVEAVRAGALERPTGRSGLTAGQPPTLPAQTRLPTPQPLAAPPAFVARDPELAQLDRHLAEALDGRGRVVFVTGDAGSGKTALMREFLHRALAAHDDLVAADGSCNAASGMGDPYLPFREILQMLAGDIEARRAGGTITAEHARRLWSLLPTTVQALVNQGPDLINLFVPGAELLLRADSVTIEHADGAAWRGRLAKLVEAAPERTFQQQTHVCEQVSRVLQEIARRCPLLLVLDDLQWVDHPSSGLLFHLGRHLAGSRILLLGAYRSPDVELGRDGARHPLAAVVNEFRRDFGEIQVDLEQASGRPFLDALLDTEPNRFSSAFRDTLYRHTGGHALFTIEALRGLQERGDLLRDGDGRWIEGPHLDWERLPPRVEAVIAERIARLPPEAQALLAAASVEGEEFTAEVAARVLGIERAAVLRQLSDTLGKLHKLVRGCRVVWLESSEQPLSRYRFQHVLFQEYLYGRLDPVEQARLHRRTGEALEQLYGSQAAEIAVPLAWHFERAGLMARAVDYLLEAGRQAMRLAAYQEAAVDFDRGLALLATLPETPERAQRELRLRLALGGPLVALHRMADAVRARSVAPAIALSWQAGDSIQALHALLVEASAARDRGDFGRALELGEQMLALGEANRHRQATMLAHYILGTTSSFSGEVVQARAELKAALSLYNDAEDRWLISLTGADVKALMLSWLAPPLWALGYPDQAASRAREAFRLAQELAQPFTLAAVLATTVWLSIYARIDQDLQHQQDLRYQIETLQRLVNEKWLEVLRPWANVYGGWLLAQQGRVAEGVERMHSSIAAWCAAGMTPGAPGLLVDLAQVCLEAGLPDEGLRAVSEALALVEAGIGHYFEAEIYRLRGALTLGRGEDGSVEAAEEDFLKAIGVAHEQQSRSWELRATVDLARLWRRVGRGRNARGRLAAIYEQFSEGFNTPDLREAATLLQELTGDGSCSDGG